MEETNENLDNYLALMFEDHREDIEAIERLDSKRTGITFRNIRDNQKNVNIDRKLRRILYVGNNTFSNTMYKNLKEH